MMIHLLIELLKNYLLTLTEKQHNLIISSHLFPSSEDLDELMTIVNLPLPDQKELKSNKKNCY